MKTAGLTEKNCASSQTGLEQAGNKYDPILAAHPLEIYEALDSVFAGEDWLGFSPETLLLSLKSEISEAAVDKICAVLAVCSNPDSAAKRAICFEKAVNALCNNIVVGDVIQPPEIEEISYALDQIRKLVKRVHGCDFVPAGEVPDYVAAVGNYRGWFVLPKNLSFAQKRLDEINGNTRGSDLRKEYGNLLDTALKFIEILTRKDARQILESPEIKALAKDDMAAMLIRRYVGAILYDPTLPHRKNPR